MKFSELQYQKFIPLQGIGGAFIRNLPLSQYNDSLELILVQYREMSDEDFTNITDGNIEDKVDKANEFKDAVNTLIKTLVCDEDGEPFDGDDIYEEVPVNVVNAMLQSVIEHINGVSGK